MHVTVKTVKEILREASRREVGQDPERIRRRYLKHNDPALGRDVRKIVVKVLKAAVQIGREPGNVGLVRVDDRRLEEVAVSTPEFWFISEDMEVLAGADGLVQGRTLSKVAETFVEAVDELVFMIQTGEVDNGPYGSEKFVVFAPARARVLSIPPDEALDTISYEIHLRVVDAIREQYDFDQIEEFDRRYGALPWNLRAR